MRTRQNDTDSYSSELLDSAEVIEPQDTRASKVHVTLRLSPQLYRSILQHKMATHAETTTAAIEDLIKAALFSEAAEPDADLAVAIRNLTMHAAHQDHLLKVLIRKVKPNGPTEKRVLEDYEADAAQFKRWLSTLIVDTVDTPISRKRAGTETRNASRR